MGCDMHMIVEVRHEDGWEAVTAPRPVWVAAFPYLFEETEEDSSMRQYIEREAASENVWWPCPRNYSFFARLSGVRNYDERSTPILIPASRDGMPEDTEWAPFFDDDVDLHHDSWFTLREGYDESLLERGGGWWRTVIQYLTELVGRDNLDAVRFLIAYDN